MKSNHLFIILLIAATSLVFCQEPKSIKVESFGYPIFDEKYDFGDFSVSYPINGRTEIMVKGFHEKTPAFEIFRAQLLLRKQIARKLYGLGGVQYEWNLTAIRNNQSVGNSNDDGARKQILLGLEYEPKPNLLIQATYGHQLNNPKFTPLGTTNPSGKSVFSLGSRLKF